MYRGAIRYEGAERPKSVCRKCQEVLPAYEASVWRELAESLNDRCMTLQTEKNASDARIKELEEALREPHRTASMIQGRSAPPYYFVRDATSKVAHHWSYLEDENDTALCGHEYNGDIVYESSERPPSVCDQCEALLPRYEAQWWRGAARSTEFARRKLQQRADLQSNDFKRLRREYNELLSRYTFLLGENRAHQEPDNVDPDSSGTGAVRDPLLDLIDE